MPKKRRLTRNIFLALFLVLVIMQFMQPKKNLGGDQSKHISTLYATPAEVKSILAVACDDCHSNYTKYPWYGYTQPVAWWLDGHINDGKRHLNFSEFAGYRPAKQFHKLEEVEELVGTGDMPLESYTKMHHEAKLSQEQKTALINWTIAVREQMRAQYPPDSLVMPKRR